MATMDDTTHARVRWFHLTPGRFVIGLLAVEVLLWLSERFGWLGWHKGYAVLTTVAVVGVGMLMTGVWFGVALVFRRRFQFGLRALLLLAVVMALPCSWMATEMNRAGRQTHAIVAIKKLGGSALYNYYGEPLLDWADTKGMPPTELPVPTVLQNLLGKDFFSDCILVYLSKPETDDLGLQALDGLPHLRRLHMLGTKVTDTGFQRLERLSQLRVLDLNGTQISDGGMEHLQGLTQLRALNLSKTKITDAGLHQLRNLLQLRSLGVSETRVSDAGLGIRSKIGKLDGVPAGLKAYPAPAVSRPNEPAATVLIRRRK